MSIDKENMQMEFDKKIVKAKWLRFLERIDGKDFYEYGNGEYRKGVCCYQLNDYFYSINTYKCTYIKAREQKYYITQETKARFISVYNDCMQDIESAKKEENGFFRADFEDKYLAYKQKARGVYQIIAVNEKDDTIYQMFSGLYDFLMHFDFECFSPTSLRFDALEKILTKIKVNTFPLLISAKEHQDKYLEYELKYFSDCATQEEIDYLNSLDSKHRFIPIPRIENIEIIRCSKMSKTLLNHLEKYLFTVIIDNKERHAIYYPSRPNRLLVFRYPENCEIEISNDIVMILQTKINAINKNSL